METFDTLRTHLPRWTVAISDLGDDLMGFCDLDRQTIWVDVNLSDRERRSTIMHEIVHALHGDQHGLDPAAEYRTSLEAARRLIHPSALRALFHLGASFHPGDIADALDVDLDVLRMRMRHLDKDERSMLRRALAPSAAGSSGDQHLCSICRWWRYHAQPDPLPCGSICLQPGYQWNEPAAAPVLRLVDSVAATGA